MKGQYVIIDLRNMDFMKNEEGKINYYDTEYEACLVCGMYEFENAWVMKLIYNHIEAEQQQLHIHDVVGRSEQLLCSMAGKGFCPYEGKDGKCTMLDKCVNHTTK